MQYTTEQLIKKLQELPQDLKVRLYDVGTDKPFDHIYDIAQEDGIIVIKFNELAEVKQYSTNFTE